MAVPVEFSFQVEFQVLDLIRTGKLHVVHVGRWAHSCTCCERNDRFECVGLDAPLVEPGLDCVEVGLEFQESCGWVSVRCENCCHQQRLLWLLPGRLEGPRCIWARGTAREHCLVEHRSGLVIRDAGQSQIWWRNACLAERIGEGGSIW
jgi:hypothetical protein